MATATVPVTSKRRVKQPIVRKRTTKPRSVQTAIAVRRMNGESKSKIARELGIARHTVTSIVELTDIDQQIGQYRRDALAIVPDAITAVQSQVQAGDGDLGLRLLERTGVIGADAIDTVRRANSRTNGAINILVQSHDATVSVTSDVPSHTDAPTVNNDNATSQLTNGNDAATAPAPTPGKHPK